MRMRPSANSRSVQPAQAYVYKFDKLHMAAYRQNSDGKEWAHKVEAGAHDSDFVKAHFADEVQQVKLSTMEYNQLTALRCEHTSKVDGTIWRGVHTFTNFQLRIAPSERPR